MKSNIIVKTDKEGKAISVSYSTDQSIQPVCYKCGSKAERVNLLSYREGSNHAVFSGFCPKCKAELTWTYTLDISDGTETWEFMWIRKTLKKGIGDKKALLG